jgi:hypothetical protein
MFMVGFFPYLSFASSAEAGATFPPDFILRHSPGARIHLPFRRPPITRKLPYRPVRQQGW